MYVYTHTYIYYTHKYTYTRILPTFTKINILSVLPTDRYIVMWNLCLLSQYINIVFYSSVSLICVKTLHIKYSRCVIYTTVVQSLYESFMVTEMVRFPNYHVFSTVTLMVKLSKMLSKYWLVEGGSSLSLSLWRRTLKRFFFFVFYIDTVQCQVKKEP